MYLCISNISGGIFAVIYLLFAGLSFYGSLAGKLELAKISCHTVVVINSISPLYKSYKG